jgi:gamma-glutamylcyclotransferase (GGCT)/AIG2-like uncharacterized protein YtfP
MLSLLFVYGTLRPDIPDSKFSLIDGIATDVGRGRVWGRLVDLGAYPGLVLNADGRVDRATGHWVLGEVFELSAVEPTLLRLDRYEGCRLSDPMAVGFHRVEARVVLDGGQVVPAWVYAYRVAGSRRASRKGE